MPLVLYIKIKSNITAYFKMTKIILLSFIFFFKIYCFEFLIHFNVKFVNGKANRTLSDFILEKKDKIKH